MPEFQLRLQSMGVTEPTTGADTTKIKTAAVRKGNDRYVVNGRKCMISRGGLADYYLVVCRFESQPGLDGVGAVIIERGTPGLSFGKAEDTLGFRGVPATDMIMEECPIPLSNVLVGSGGFKRLMATYNGQRLGAATVALGLAQGAFEHAVRYAGEADGA